LNLRKHKKFITNINIELILEPKLKEIEASKTQVSYKVRSHIDIYKNGQITQEP
jgi:hypothetical protein